MQGRVLGNRYRLASLLGQGGMGTVWEADQLNLPIRLAIKLINPAYSNSSEVQERFEREAYAAAKLRSMHIVQITDYGIDGDTPYIVMELLVGESLAARLRRKGRLSLEETLRIMSQVAKALTLAHENAIVHRDLKPENIFIERSLPQNDDSPEDELVKVLDFGVAKMLDTRSVGDDFQTRTGVFLGTPFYMSSEQIRDSSSVDHRTDVWSFGVITYECLTGRRPFQATNLADLQFAICRDPLPLPSEVAPVPQGFDEWFHLAISRDVAQRFSTIRAAMGALKAIADMNSVRDVALLRTPDAGKTSMSEDGQRALSPEVKHHQRELATPLTRDLPSPPPVVPNTASPSSVTTPRLSKRAETRGVIIALSVLLGAAVTFGYRYLQFKPTLEGPDSRIRPSVPAASAVGETSTKDVVDAALQSIPNESHGPASSPLNPSLLTHPVPQQSSTERNTSTSPHSAGTPKTGASILVRKSRIPPRATESARLGTLPKPSEPNKYGFE